MYNHAPADYHCPICLTVRGIENEHNMAKQTDIVYRDDLVLVFVNSKFMGDNPGHLIVVPVEHFEHLYDLPMEYGYRVMEISQRMARALKEVRQCDGVWILQNNEPASGQHAFHYHLHLVPRFTDDRLPQKLSEGSVRVADPEERAPYALALRSYLEQHP
jgi:histidine triad (HIT) family protein